MSPVEFKIIIPSVVSVILFLMSIGFMSPVDFKKWSCRPVKFKGQVPLTPLSVHTMGGSEVAALAGSLRGRLDTSTPTGTSGRRRFCLAVGLGRT